VLERRQPIVREEEDLLEHVRELVIAHAETAQRPADVGRVLVEEPGHARGARARALLDARVGGRARGELDWRSSLHALSFQNFVLGLRSATAVFF
jgi:hypothetical protein